MVQKIKGAIFMEKLICPICNKEFKKLDSFNAHKTYHKNLEKYPNGVECPVCKKHFAALKSLLRHSSIEHNEPEQIIIYRTIYEDNKDHFCENCSKPSMFLSTRKGFSRYCSIECRDVLNKKYHKLAMENIDYSKVDFESRNAKSRETWNKNLGVDNPQKNPQVRKRTEKTNLEKYKSINPMNNPEVGEKQKATLYKNYQVTNPMKNKEIAKRVVETRRSRLKEGETFFTKSQKTYEEQTGYRTNRHNPESEARRKRTIEDIYGGDFSRHPDVIAKRLATNIREHGNASGVEYEKWYGNKEWLDQKLKKSYETKKKNNTFHTSKKEKLVYDKLIRVFPDLIYQYKGPNFRYTVDFYVPSFDLYLDFHGTWTHGDSFYDSQNKDHQERLQFLEEKSKTSKYYKNAIYTWTDLDVRKVKEAEELNINYLVIWNNDIEILYEKVSQHTDRLTYLASSKEIENELKILTTKEGDYQSKPQYNKLVLSIQQHFFERENLLWQDPPVREKLLLNREKYLSKSRNELTVRELLRGFKISKLFHGFSHFSPFWIKYFVEKYNISSIYDPCGGWGHRLLGALNCNYIYNDLDSRTYNGVKDIWGIAKKFSKNSNKYFYNEDAALLTPFEQYESIFTCPPYYNLEKYTYEESASNKETYEEFLAWWKGVLEKSITNNVKYFGYVIHKNLYKDMNNLILDKGFVLIETSSVGPKNSNFITNKKLSDSNELLFIFQKIT